MKQGENEKTAMLAVDSNPMKTQCVMRSCPPNKRHVRQVEPAVTVRKRMSLKLKFARIVIGRARASQK